MQKSSCSNCDKPIELNRRRKQRYCKKCHAAHMRKTRKKHSELTPEEKVKSNCRSYLNTYVKRGIVARQPCLICGDKKSQAHHEDYSKPLDVIWYCRQHHTNHHRLAKIAA